MVNMLKAEIDGWYTKLNTIRLRLGLSEVKAPNITNTSPTKSTDLDVLKSQFTEMRADRYFSYATYHDLGDTAPGRPTLLSTRTAADGTLESIDTIIKCRNDAANSYGSNSNGSNSNGSNSNGSNSQGTQANGSCSNGTCQNGSLSNGKNSLGANEYLTLVNGYCPQNSNTNGHNSNGSNSYGTNGRGTYSNGGQSNGVRSNTSTIDVSNTNSTKSNTAGGQAEKW